MIPQGWNVGQVEREAVPHLLASYGDEDYLLEEMQESSAGWWGERGPVAKKF